jgi:RHS repeat-associated protein
MKTTRILTLALLATVLFCQPGQSLALVRSNADPAERQAALDAIQGAQDSIQPYVFGAHEPAAPIAEQITGDIAQLARNLENDPVRIFNYVHDHIRHVLYFGSKKGAALTLLEKSGNDFDQCALLMALLRAANYTNASYQFGWMELPYDSADHKDLHHWLQLSVTNSAWNTTSNYLDTLVRVYRGYPADAAIWGTNLFAFQRIWVKLTIGSTNYNLDPSFKVSEPITGISIPSAINVSSNSLMSAAGGTDTGSSVTGLSEAGLRGTLTQYTTNLLNYIQSNSPNASVAAILGGWQIVPSTNTVLSQSLPFNTYDWGGQMPILTWGNQPTNLMSTLTIGLEGTNFQCYMPQLRGQRLTLTYYNFFAQLWLEDTDVADGYAYTGDVTISVNHPVGLWNTNNNSFVDTTAYDQATTNNYAISNAESPGYSVYNLIYGFEPDWSWLQERQDWLDYLRILGYADDSFDVIAETMNVMGLQYALQCWYAGLVAAPQAAVLPQNYHLMGRLGEEGDNGYYFDIFMVSSGDVSSAGNDATSTNRLNNYEGLQNYLYSALEHGVIEQLQNSNYVAASTIKMLEIAVTNGQAVYLANSANWQTGANVRSSLTGYTPDNLGTFDSLIAQGDVLLMPQYGGNYVDGGGSWSGYGYVDHNRPGSAGMIINGLFGGQVSYRYAVVNSAYVVSCGQAQPRRRPFRVNPTGADPVDMANGTFQVDHTDLSLGQAEPMGISFGRYYNSLNRHVNSAGMAPGWVHNYYVNARPVPAPQAALGNSTPAQMAPMIAATCAGLAIYNDAQPDPKNWTVTALIAKWAIDQLNQKGVSVVMGKDTVQFVQQPDGRFTPPANCTWTLTQPSNYVLQERHGNTFNFDSLGRLTSIVDPYSQSLNISFVSSGSLLPQQVTDWKNRTLQFNYANGVLTNITDGAARKVYYGYGTNGDLISVTDPENKTSNFTYDGDHQIVATSDALGQLVTTNLYDPYGFGLVVTQYVQGSLNKTWQVYWSGWQSVVQDPVGSKQRFLYDDSKRLVGFQDPLGNLSQTSYDGQDHVVMTISPLNETNQFVYDGNHNLLAAIDPLGYSNQFFYDGQNNLTRAVDGRGNPSTFGYNGQFSLTGSTNGAGDWVSLVYNGDGTLYTRTDPAGTTTYTYDSTYRQLSAITYPGSLGGEGFLRNAVGDVLSHTNARQFVTSYQYNLRRQLTNSIAPTNLTASAAYDAVGNLASTTDARGFKTTNAWSATRRLLARALPATPQGVPVITNSYDNRDWLTRTLNPLQQATSYTNDVAGQLVSVTDPLLRATRFGYDADSQRTASTNAAQEVTLQQWNPRGQMTRLTDPATHTVLHAYDGAGNQTILTNRNSKQWQFQFDAANRLTNTITPMLYSTKLAYNNLGLLQSVTKPSTQSATFGYDGKGRQTNRADQVGTTTYQYDPNNNLTNVSENGRTNSWAFDAYNRVSSYRDTDGNLIQYRRDQNGNVTSLIYPGNRTVSYSYDSLNRLTNVTDWASGQTTLVYDLANHLTSITRPNGTVRLINYDAAGETTNIIEKTTSGFPIAFYQLNYDSAARVQWEFGAPLPQTNTAPPARTMTYNDDNQIATFRGPTMGSAGAVGYDADGNLTWGPVTNDTFVTCGYNARNQLTNAAGFTYAYDPAGNRIAVTNGASVTRFITSPNAALSQALMRVRAGVTNYYIYGPGLLYEITETATATSTLTYHYDLRGSTIALTDNNGNVTDRVQYSAYGMIMLRGGTNDTPFLYNGRYGVMTDANGLLHMRARYYNPYLCRFINPDPAGFSGGLNFYAYADGNPISLIDPFGLGAGEASGFSWLRAWNTTGAWLIPGAASAQNAYTFYSQGNYANGTASVVSSGGEAVLGGLMYANSAASSSLGRLGNWISSLWGDGASGAEGELYSTTAGQGMNTSLFQRIQSAFQRQGGVMQVDAESTRLLNTLGVEGATVDAKTILLPQSPSTSAVYEELIHSAQLRAGMTDSLQMEIQAAQKLIRFSDAYNIPAAETQQTINRLNSLLLQQGR